MSLRDDFSAAYDIDDETGCWVWNRTLLQNGYGQMWDGASVVFAHRYSYKTHVGYLLPGMVIDHKCRNRACVNPQHLQQVTQRINILTGVGVTANNSRKTRCVNGHEFTEENTYIVKKRRNGRHCKKCSSINQRNYRERKRLEKHII